jgi:large subunit ribosomal protein LP1
MPRYRIAPKIRRAPHSILPEHPTFVNHIRASIIQKNQSRCRTPSWPLPMPPSSSPMTGSKSQYDSVHPDATTSNANDYLQADKLNTLIKAANVSDVEPIWATLFAKALDGKDVKDMLLNVGSGGGAAAPAAGGASGGGAAAGGAPAEETKEEEKEEGQCINNNTRRLRRGILTNNDYREGGVRRGHGLRSLRLSAQSCNSHRPCITHKYRYASPDAHMAHVVTDGWKRATLGKDGPARAQRGLLRLMRTTRHAQKPLQWQYSKIIDNSRSKILLCIKAAFFSFLLSNEHDRDHIQAHADAHAHSSASPAP